MVNTGCSRFNNGFLLQAQSSIATIRIVTFEWFAAWLTDNTATRRRIIGDANRRPRLLRDGIDTRVLLASITRSAAAGVGDVHDLARTIVAEANAIATIGAVRINVDAYEGFGAVDNAAWLRVNLSLCQTGDSNEESNRLDESEERHGGLEESV